VTNGLSDNVMVYAIDTTTGVITSVGSPLATGSFPRFVTIDPSGKFAYVANQGSNDISIFAINAGTGALTVAGTVPAGITPTAITIDRVGKFAYIANNGGNSVSVFSVNVTTGALTSVGASAATGNQPNSIAIAM